MSFIAELKRRNVIRAAGLYLVGAWLVVQVSSTVLPLFGAPQWLTRSIVILLAVGFVPAMIFSWVFELTPEGIKRDEEVPLQESIAPQTARKMDRMIIAMLALALAYFGFDKFVLAPRRDAALVAQTTARATAHASTETPKVNPRSIAVLPFVNMSADAENEFFADGLSEEILNSLARIDSMQVVGRTSSFQFKGKNEDLRTIGAKLGVASVLEGSVRRDGDRARITAQLIRTSDGIHLWSQTYDRTLKDSLAVQLDIAEQVAGVLDVVLDDKQRARMHAAGVQNVDAFIAYQKGLKLYDEAHARGNNTVDGLRLANVEFAKATTLDPDFSMAWYASADLDDHILLADDQTKADRVAAQREGLHVLELAAASSKDDQQRLLILAEQQLMSDDWHGLPARIDAALTHPGCSAPNFLPVFASAFGFGDRIEDLGARVSACDPLNFLNFHTRFRGALAAGRPQRALDILAEAEKVKGGSPIPRSDQVRALVMLGRISDAKSLLATLEPDNEGYYIALASVGAAGGVDPKNLHARLLAVDRSKSRLKFWMIADVVEAALSGDRAEANRRAAALDARPAGGFSLAVVTSYCLCGAPFDLDATPNFKARLAESGLPWPPTTTIKSAPPKQAPHP